MDLEILKDYFEAIEKEMNVGEVEKLQLYKAMLKHKCILDEEISRLVFQAKIEEQIFVAKNFLF